MLTTKKKMNQDFECKYCGTKFHKETTLATHVCVKKRRYMDMNTAGARFGFRTFQKFYELTVKSKKIKTHDEFINSTYYIDFVKFGNHLASLKPVYPEKFIDFVILNSVKLKDWTKDFVYDVYIDEMVKKEPATSAAERTITEIMEWSVENNTEFKDFFTRVSANEASYMIRTGKISPWVLYLAESGENLMSRFTDDHSKIIGTIIDPGFWMKKFKKADEDVSFIREILGASGL